MEASNSHQLFRFQHPASVSSNTQARYYYYYFLSYMLMERFTGRVISHAWMLGRLCIQESDIGKSHRVSADPIMSRIGSLLYATHVYLVIPEVAALPHRSTAILSRVCLGLKLHG